MQAFLSSALSRKALVVTTLSLAASLAASATEATGASAVKQPAAAPAATAGVTPSKSKKAIAEEALVNKFVDLQDAAIKTFLELGGTLRGVKDKASADAAAPTVKMAGEQLCTIISAVEALGEPSEAAQQAIMARVANVAEKNEIVEQVMLPMLSLMMQEPPCHGSDSLQTELTNLLTNLQGAAGMEDADEGEDIEFVPLMEPDADETAEAK